MARHLRKIVAPPGFASNADVASFNTSQNMNKAAREKLKTLGRRQASKRQGALARRPGQTPGHSFRAEAERRIKPGLFGRKLAPRAGLEPATIRLTVSGQSSPRRDNIGQSYRL